MSKPQLFVIIINIRQSIEIFYLTYNIIGGVCMITKDMTITDIVEKYPDTVPVFQRYGMHCFG